MGPEESYEKMVMAGVGPDNTRVTAGKAETIENLEKNGKTLPSAIGKAER